MSTYDVLIIGGGPAGLTAATTLVRQLHTAVVFDSGSYRNGRSTHMHNIPTWDHRDPKEFREKSRKDLLERYDTVSFQDVEITKLKKLDGEGGFEAQDAAGNTWVGKKVILASGVADDFPEVPGYEDCWAKGIFHCLFCHGYEQRGAASAGVLAIQGCAAVPPALHLSRNTSRLAQSVTIYTDGSQKLDTDLTTTLGPNSPIKVDKRPIKCLKRLPATDPEKSEVEIEFQDGSKKTEAFLTHSPKTHVKGPFIEQLGLETAPPLGDLKVSPPFGQTSVHGVFAAGDNMTMFKAVPSAISNGSMAAVGVSMQLQAESFGHKPMF